MKKGFITLAVLMFFFVNLQAQQGWAVQTNPLGPQGSPTPALGKLQFVSPTEGWITSGNGNLLHTTNGGTVWTVETPGGSDTVGFSNSPGFGLSFVNAATGWVIGTLGGLDSGRGAVLYKTTNSGGTWTRQLLSPWTYGFGIQFVDVNNGWASVVSSSPTNGGGAILHTTDGGANWSTQYLTHSTLAFVSFSDSTTGLAIADSISNSGFIPPCKIMYTTNGGGTWTTQLNDTTPGSFESLQLIDAQNGWVVGDSAKIFHTANGGTNWTQVTNTGNNSEHRAVFFLNDSLGWIGGRPYSDQGTPIVLHTTNGGGSWSTQYTPTQTESIFGIYFIDAEYGWYSADYGGIAHTTDGGEPTSVREVLHSTVPNGFELAQNYPDPFNPSTIIQFTVPSDGRAVLRVFNVLGQEVATLYNDEAAAGVVHQVQFNGSNLASGIYFSRLESGGNMQVKKMLLLK